MFGEPLPIMNSVVGNRGAVQPMYFQSPHTRLTLEQMYQQAGQPTQSSPYEDYKKVMESCTDSVRGKMAADERFQSVHAECENLIKQYLYEQVIPQILQTQPGLTAFERLYATAKQVREDCIRQEVQQAQEIERLLSDDLVQERLKEIRQEDAQRGQ